MAMTAERKAQLDALLNQNQSVSSSGTPEQNTTENAVSGLTNDRKAQLDSLVATVKNNQPKPVEKKGFLAPTDISTVKGVVPLAKATIGNDLKSLVKTGAGLLSYPFIGAPKAIYNLGKEVVGTVKDIKNGVNPLEIAKNTVTGLPAAAAKVASPPALQKGYETAKTEGVGEGVYQGLKDIAEDPYQLLPYFLMAKGNETLSKPIDAVVAKGREGITATKNVVKSTADSVKSIPGKVGYEGTGIDVKIPETLKTQAKNKIADNFREVSGQTQTMRKFLQKSGSQNQDPAQWLADRNIVPEVKSGKVQSMDMTGKPTYNFDELAKPLYDAQKTFIRSVQPSIPLTKLSDVESLAIEKARTPENISKGTAPALESHIREAFDTYRNEPSIGEQIPLDTLLGIKQGRWAATKFDSTKPYQGDANFLIGQAAKEVIENSIPKEFGPVIKELNKELGDIYNAEKFYTKLDGRPVKGGRLGGYATSIAGSIVGHGIGVPGGSALGYIVGGALADILQSSAISDFTKAYLLKEVKATQPEIYSKVVDYVKGLKQEQAVRPALPAPGYTPLPEQSPSGRQAIIDKSGIIPNAPEPKVLPQEIRPGQPGLPAPGQSSYREGTAANEVIAPPAPTTFEPRAQIIGGKGQTVELTKPKPSLAQRMFKKIGDIKSGKSQGHTFNLDGSTYKGNDAIATVYGETLSPGQANLNVIQNIIDAKKQIYGDNKNVKVGVFPMKDGGVSVDINIATKNRKIAEIIARRNNQQSYYDANLGKEIKTQGNGVQNFSDAQIKEVLDRVDKFNVDNPEVQKLADGYMKSIGGNKTQDNVTFSFDEVKAAKIADAFDKMKDQPNNPEVKASYQALATETKQQYDWLVDHGYKIEPWRKKGQPYKNSAAMVDDVLKNKHLYFFLTDEGFGSGVSKNHPLLKDSGIKSEGVDLKFNDLFRAVHDIFGHAKIGNQFQAFGEENAWKSHSQMFSEEAKKAMTTETRGQNSWVNYGKHLRNKNGGIPVKGDKGYIPPSERPYAKQKTGLLPEEFLQ